MPVIYQRLPSAEALETSEPRDGHALVTCKIRVQSGAYNAWEWESRTYEFRRTRDGWTIYTDPGYLPRPSWRHVIDWFRRMAPIEIDLLTTV